MPSNLDSLILTGGPLWLAATVERMGLGTIPTTVGVTSTYIARYAGTITAIQMVAKDALTANDTNFFLITVNNRGSGGANTAVLAVSAANGSQATGGAAVVAWTKRTLTLNATPANLAVAAGDTIEFTAAVTGTLANAVAGVSFLVTFAPS